MTALPKHSRKDSEETEATSAAAAAATRKTVLTPKFGAQLRRLRGQASRGEICRMLATQGLKINRSTLLQYERGSVKNPSLAILWTLSQHYRLTHAQFCQLVTLHTRELLGTDADSGVLDARDDVETRRLTTVFRGFPLPLQKAVMTILLRMQSGDADVARLLSSNRKRKA